MTENRAFWRAIHSLAHPLTIVAIGVLLVNDHWLRWQHPSWLAGKLGDFTWLIFAPFIAALFLSLIIPRRIGRHEQRVGLLAFLIIGGWFALAKTVPAVNFVTVQAWNGLVGWQGINRLDATDLMTLPALLIGAYIWRQAAHTAINLRPLGYVAFAFGIVATLASSPIPDTPGITLICETASHELITFAIEHDNFNKSSVVIDNNRFNTILISRDGGYVWQYAENIEISQSEDGGLPQNMRCSDESLTAHPENSLLQYRWQQEAHVELSVDGGITWDVDRELVELQQDVRLYYDGRMNDFISDSQYLLSPVSGLVHSQTSNLILAMSKDGVLVRSTNGIWDWVQVGTFVLEDLQQLSEIKRVIELHGYLVITLFFLILTSTAAIIRKPYLPNTDRFLWIGFGWAGWIVLIMLAGPLGNFSFITFGIVGIFFLGAVGLHLGLGAIWDMARNFRGAFLPVVITAIPAIAAFMFPFVLWAVGTIPRYFTAAIFSILLTGSVLIAAFVFWKPRLPTLEKAKRKNEDKTGKNLSATDSHNVLQ